MSNANEIPEGATRHAMFNGRMSYYRPALRMSGYEQYIDGVWMEVGHIERSSSPISEPPYSGQIVKQHISGASVIGTIHIYKGD